MKKYHNKKDIIRIGVRIRDLRKESGFSLDDIADMTGFSKSTISSIENGGETNTSHLVEIAKAIGIHPMEIFNISFEIKPRYKLSANRRNRQQLTFRIQKLLTESDYFDSPRFVSDITSVLFEEYNIQPDASSLSVILLRFVKDGMLSYHKEGRRNQYFAKKSGDKKKKT